MSLDAFFQPRSIAVIGASADASSISGRPLRLLRQHGYQGAVYPVNPRHAELEGLRSYPRIRDLPGPVDLAVVAVPARRAPAVVGECAEAGVSYAMVLSSGFEEAGAEGRALQADLAAAVVGSRLRICGPNCEGFYNARTGLAVGFSPALDPDRGFLRSPTSPPTGSGPVAVVAQSGGQGFALFRRGIERGLGFSLVISTGNDADLGWPDYVEYLLDDPATRVILGFVEGLRDARRLIAVAARAAELGKPLVIAKIGRSDAGRRAAASHTGNLVGSDDAYTAAFRQLGVVRVDDVDELLDAAAYFSHGRLPAGRRVAILTASGGAGAWLADATVTHGLELPPLEPALEAELRTFIPPYASTANPVDITAQAVYDGGYERALRLLAHSRRFDAIVSAVSLAGEHHASALTARLTEALDGVDTPLVYYAYTSPDRPTLESLAELGVPCYPTPARAARSLGWAAWYAEFRRRRQQVALLQSIAAGETLEPDAMHVLAAAGIAYLPGRRARTPDEAVAIHAELGGPVALKLISPDLTHKTEVGGVRLNLTTACEVRAAFDGVLASAGPHRVDGVLVQAMAPAGVELIVAAKRDAALGPLIVVGMGGTLVELLADTSLRLAPISSVEARAMLEELRGAPLLRGFRGQPPADIPALVDALVRLSQVALRLPADVLAFEINPLLVVTGRRRRGRRRHAAGAGGQHHMTVLLYTIDEGVATITLNRPERLNAFDEEMIELWVDALGDARQNEAVQVIVVTGAGRAFCSGGDVGGMAGRAPRTGLEHKRWLERIHRVPLTLEQIDKPVIAALNGPAVGAGLDMALMCDLRYAAAGIRVSEGYVKVGLIPGDGGSYFLPRLVGTARALELLWTGDPIDADQAERIGLVNRVVPADELLPRCTRSLVDWHMGQAWPFAPPSGRSTRACAWISAPTST